MTPFGTSVMSSGGAQGSSVSAGDAAPSPLPSFSSKKGSLPDEHAARSSSSSPIDRKDLSFVSSTMTTAGCSHSPSSDADESDKSRHSGAAPPYRRGESSSRSRSATPLPDSRGSSEDEYVPTGGELRNSFLSASSDDDGDGSDSADRTEGKGKQKRRSEKTAKKTDRQKTAMQGRRKRAPADDDCEVNRVKKRGARGQQGSVVVDDGDEAAFQKRLR